MTRMRRRSSVATAVPVCQVKKFEGTNNADLGLIDSVVVVGGCIVKDE